MKMTKSFQYIASEEIEVTCIPLFSKCFILGDTILVGNLKICYLLNKTEYVIHSFNLFIMHLICTGTVLDSGSQETLSLTSH